MIQSDDRDLLEAYLAFELDEEEIKALEYRICTEEDLARLLIQTSCEETVIREWSEIQKSRVWIHKLVGQTPARQRSLIHRYISIALMLVVAVTLGYVLGLPRSISERVTTSRPENEMPLIHNAATFKEITGGELKSLDVLCKVDEHLQTRREYHLNQGILRLKMNSGVEVLVAGPARFHLLSSNELFLSQGTMTADVPQRAIGFEIQSSHMKIVDLGTRFGFFVDEAGGAEVHVFQGAVSCQETEKSKTPRLPQLLFTGQSSKKEPGGDLVESQTETDSLFGACLCYQSRIKQLSGDLKLLSNLPESVAVTKLTSNEYMYVFQERQSFILPADINCNAPVPGKKQDVSDKASQSQFEAGVIKKGTRVDVYYVHHDAHHPGNPKFSKTQTRIQLEGQLEFQNRILGILQTDQLLQQTDQILGHPEVEYLSNGKQRNDRTAEDEISLLPDMRTLSLNWILSRNQGHQNMNAMRVLVAADE
tara:strand:- start:1497 stop:2933 length:1437 start_codon:yes stop_codon:yes gene_type:complete